MPRNPGISRIPPVQKDAKKADVKDVELSSQALPGSECCPGKGRSRGTQRAEKGNSAHAQTWQEVRCRQGLRLRFKSPLYLIHLHLLSDGQGGGVVLISQCVRPLGQDPEHGGLSKLPAIF